jgi:FkbM family methyltransferase
MGQTLRQFRYAIKSTLTWVHSPIRGGPLQGLRWCVFTGIRFVRGDYHLDEVDQLQSLIKPGDVVYDIGAHVGYYTVVAARKTGASGRVIAFEPLPMNLKFLRQHIALNGIANISVLPLALSDGRGQTSFDLAGGSGRGRVSSEGSVPIEMACIDELCAAGQIPPPALIKMDIEGGELRALLGARKTLETYRPVIFLATHGATVRAQCEALLNELGYRLRDFRQSDIIATPG